MPPRAENSESARARLYRTHMRRAFEAARADIIPGTSGSYKMETVFVPGTNNNQGRYETSIKHAGGQVPNVVITAGDPFISLDTLDTINETIQVVDPNTVQIGFPPKASITIRYNLKEEKPQVRKRLPLVQQLVDIMIEYQVEISLLLFVFAGFMFLLATLKMAIIASKATMSR